MSNADKRARQANIRAYKLRQEGLTNREIAALLMCDIDAVPGKVLAGQRALGDGGNSRTSGSPSAEHTI
jgi:hypothetical protein